MSLSRIYQVSTTDRKTGSPKFSFSPVLNRKKKKFIIKNNKFRDRLIYQHTKNKGSITHNQFTLRSLIFQFFEKAFDQVFQYCIYSTESKLHEQIDNHLQKYYLHSSFC